MNILAFWLLSHLLFSPATNAAEVSHNKVKEAFEYCEQNDLSTEMCIFLDMNIHSGKRRLFVYDFKNEKVLLNGLCAHGCCNGTWGGDRSKNNPTFSNTPNSHCSSLGKYKLGARGWSNWGININYKMHGLEASNSNAYSRYIVLHSWNAVSDIEIYPKGTAEGWGCPAVSNNTMRKLDALLKETDKNVLFWIYK